MSLADFRRWAYENVPKELLGLLPFPDPTVEDVEEKHVRLLEFLNGEVPEELRNDYHYFYQPQFGWRPYCRPLAELVSQPIWQRLVIDGSRDRVSFFTDVESDGHTDTNLRCSGCFKHECYLIHGVGIHLPGEHRGCLDWAFHNEAHLRLIIGAKYYWRGPVHLMTPDRIPLSDLSPLEAEGREPSEGLLPDLPGDIQYGGVCWRQWLEFSKEAPSLREAKGIYLPPRQSFRLELEGFRPPVPVAVTAFLEGLHGREVQ